MTYEGRAACRGKERFAAPAPLAYPETFSGNRLDAELMDLQTGHSEIDSQHEHLAQLVKGLDQVCEAQIRTGGSCTVCSPDKHPNCNKRLAELIADLLAFMFDHFSYEEKLMRQLPDTEECRAHVEEHTFAHAEVSRLLCELTTRLDRTNPIQSSLQLQQILKAWLGKHSETHDRKLAISLSGAYEAEIELDIELSRMLAA